MKVRISYSPNLYDIGTVKDLPDDEAKALIREGRAVEVYGDAEPDPNRSATYDNSGRLLPGATTVVNTTGQPERATRQPATPPPPAEAPE